MKAPERFPSPKVVPMLTVTEVAARMGVGRSKVYELVHRRGGPRAYRVGSQLRFKPEEVEEYLKQKAPRQVVMTPDRASEPIDL